MRFITEHGGIARTLSALLKKDSFKWPGEEEMAFNKLNKSTVKPPVLALPNFTIPFEIECDASERVVGAILMQNKHFIALYSQALKERSLGISTYEKELFSLVSVI